MIQWPSGEGVGRVINRSWVQIPATALSSATLVRLFTYVCLCLPFDNGVNWKVTVGLAQSWSWVNWVYPWVGLGGDLTA